LNEHANTTIIDGVSALALDTQEFCRSSNLSKAKLASALAELELAGFIVNATPGNPPLASAWKLTTLSYDGQPPTRDYLRPEVIERIEQAKAARRMARRGRRANGAQS
jgi:hypothetical protein